MITGMYDLTPVEDRGGRWYKRDDLFRHPSGVNGAKWRQCQWLVRRMRAEGAPLIVTGASVLSPQHAMTAVAAAESGLPSLHVVGGTTPDKARKHPSVRLAVQYGAALHAIPVGYNPALQAEVRRLAEEHGAGVLRYGVTTDRDVAAFHRLGAAQAANVPPGLRSLIVPFGSGNSAASILTGLAEHPDPPEAVHLVGIGPNRLSWLYERLDRVGVGELPFGVAHHDLHGTGVVAYGRAVRYTSDGIVLHPTYEGKVAAWADSHPQLLPGWGERDGTAALWIVGGPL